MVHLANTSKPVVTKPVVAKPVVAKKVVISKKAVIAKASEAFEDFKKATLELVDDYDYQVSNSLEMVRDLVNRIKSQNLWDDISVMTEEKEIEKYVKDADDYGYDDYEDEEEKEMIEDLMYEIKDMSEELALYNTTMLSDEAKLVENIKKILDKAD